jgi:hypothetical protein
MFTEKYKRWSSSLYSFIQSPITSPALGPNILFGTLRFMRFYTLVFGRILFHSYRYKIIITSINTVLTLIVFLKTVHMTKYTSVPRNTQPTY